MTLELSPSEVAVRLGTTTRTVQRWIARGELPARRVGGRWRVAIDALDVFGASPLPAARQPAMGRAIGTLFVANRGEIAVRIRRTAEALGIRTVIPPTDGPDALDLLDVGAVVAAAVAERADAVHPGFGFLAESPDFADAVIAAGLVWVGPPPAAIRTMGDKGAARRLATRLGVPTAVGYDDPDQSDGALAAAASNLGLPLLVKPAAGGGGKGIHVLRSESELGASIAAARREAKAAFGDDRVILERFVERPRHIEIQVLFDAFGNGVHLGERDCSIQRRHQKVLEETPSPGIAPALRDRLADAALVLARAVGYVGAGTCEFLVDELDQPVFLEMNTRLQVEHPVTELVTGRDLVADQLRVAAGEPLGFGQDEVGFSGHAVEVRLYAEDAEAGFLPETGRVEALAWPDGPGIRVDSGIEVGSEISGRFDPMLAKVIAHGRDRTEAFDRLAAALDRTTVLGLITNLRFLRWLVREPAVRDGLARVDTLERIWPPDDWAARTVIPDAAWAVAASVLGRVRAPDRDPWRGGWRLNGPATIRLEVEDAVRSVPLDVAGPRPERQELPAAVRAGDTAHVDVDGRSIAFRIARPPDVDRAASAAARHTTGAVELVAPMPGSVVRIHGAVGEPVRSGESVVSLEAMKMEHAVTSPIDGRVAELRVAERDQVTRGQVLAVVEP